MAELISPAFPDVNSDYCGTCWELTYDDTTINVLAINVATNGFTISEEAFDALTNGVALYISSVNATATQVDASVCGQ